MDAVVAILAVVMIAGCGGSSKNKSSTSSTAVGPASTPSTGSVSTPAHSPTGQGKKAGKSHAQGTKPGSPAAKSGGSQPAAKPTPPAIKAGPQLTSFSGTGNGKVGNLTEKATVVLEYSTSKPPIQVFTAKGFVLVASQTGSGRVRLAHGTYPGVRVATKGHWTLSLHANR
jgi:hypothetical protein